MPRPTLGFSNGSPESIMAARFISFRTMLRIIKMEESGNGSKQTEAGWKFTICHLIHQNSTPRNLYGSIRARMEPTTDASKARRKSTRRWSKSLPECKEIQVKSRDIFNLFYSHHVPLFMSVCIAIFAWLAKQERERIAERVKAGLQRARAAGTVLGRPHGAKDKKRRSVSGYHLRYAGLKKDQRKLGQRKQK